LDLPGGKLQRDNDWFQLARIKYRTILEGRQGKIQIIGKEELKRHRISSPGVADAFALTFARRDVPLGATGRAIWPQSSDYDPTDLFASLP
jgi:hypothetical protein